MDEATRLRLDDYLRARFATQDDVLADLARQAAALPEGGMQITADVGQLLHVLAVAVSARRVLELGTFLGYSAIWLARALPPGGRLITIDVDRARAEEARGWISRGGVADRVEVRVGAALEVLRELRGAEPFDLAFVDAKKEEYPAYLDAVLPMIRRGGLLIADNVLLSGSQEGTVADEAVDSPHLRGVREFNRRIATDPRLATAAVPIREGVSISVIR